MPRSTPSYGIDTSIFVRLLTGHPTKDYEQTLEGLKKLLEKLPDAEFFVSNQVIGEAYITLQHHYGISKADAREAMLKVLTGSMIRPLNGEAALTCLRTKTGCGLLDRLIAQDYAARDAIVLTNDKKMSKLAEAKLLR